MSFTEVLAELAVNLRLDSSSFATGANRAAGSAKKLESGLAGVPRGVAAITSSLGGLAGGFASGLLIGGVAELGSKLVELGKGALEHASALHVTSQQLGVTTNDLQRYRFAAGQVGLEQEKVDLGLKRLNKSIGLADRGLGPGAKAFAAMGISVRDAAGHLKTVGEILPEIAGYIAKLPDPAARAALEFQLFGRSGQDMAPLLNIGAEGVKNLTAAADKAGAVLSPQLIERAHQLEVRFTKLKTVIETKVEAGLLTGIEKIGDAADGIGDKVKGADDWLARLQSDADKWDKSHNVPTKSQFLGQFQTAPLQAFDKWLLDLQGHADELDRRLGIPAPKAFIQGLVDEFKAENLQGIRNARKLIDDVVGALNGLPGAVRDAWQAFSTNWDLITAKTASMVASIRKSLGTDMDSITAGLKAKLDAATGFFHSMYDKVVGHSYVPDMVQGIADEFARLQQIMVDPTVSATDKVVAAFQGLASVGGQIFGRKAGGIFGAIASAVGAIAPLLGGGFHGFTVTNPSAAQPFGDINFAHRALGGPVVPGRTYMVGENGPEYLTMGGRGYVTPPKSGNDNRRPYFDLRGAVMTPDLLRQMNAIGEVASGRGAIMGAAAAEQRGFRRASQRIP